MHGFFRIRGLLNWKYSQSLFKARVFACLLPVILTSWDTAPWVTEALQGLRFPLHVSPSALAHLILRVLVRGSNLAAS